MFALKLPFDQQISRKWTPEVFRMCGASAVSLAQL